MSPLPELPETPASSALSAATRRSILLLSFATFASMAVQRLCDAMLPELARVFDTSLAQAAHVISFFAVIYGLSQLIYGPIGDRLGKYRIVSVATLCCSLGCVLSVLSPSLVWLVWARVLTALAAAAIIPLGMAWVGDHVSYEERQFTLARVGVGTTMGIVGGQLMGGLFTDTVGWRWAFVFMALLFGVVGVLLIRDQRRQPPRPTTPADLIQAPDRMLASYLEQVRMIVTAPWSRIVLTVAVIEGAAGFGVLAMWASHLYHTLDLSLSAAGATVAMFGVGGVFYMMLAKRLIPLLGEAGLTRVGVVLMGACALVVAWGEWWWLAPPSCLVGGFGFFMFHNTMQANATQMSPAARGTGVSLFAASLFLGQSVGVVLAASLVAALGSAWVIVLGGAVLVAEGFYFARALSRREDLVKTFLA
ncbi:MAG: MFS transporter [Betaproteobacteria bacterium]|nr:MFS transporter [Betaproteobacteria bacterium]